MAHSPKDPLVQVGDRIGTISIESLQESFTIPSPELVGFLKGRMEEGIPAKGTGDTPNLRLIPGAVNVNEFTDAAYAYIKEELTPKVRTPLTTANLLKWAKKQVKKEPTRNKDTVNTKGNHKFIKIKNTVALVLADIAQAHAIRNYAEHRHNELVEVIWNFCYDGTKGYKTMTVKELLAEISDAMINPKSSFYEFDDLEDLLAEFETE